METYGNCFLKLSKDLNNNSFKELISSLRSHEIEFEEDEPKIKSKYVALKSLGKYEKTKAIQAEENEDSEEEDLRVVDLDMGWRPKRSWHPPYPFD